MSGQRKALIVASDQYEQEGLRASRSRSIVLLLDCCYGGAFAQGVTVRAAGDVNVLDSFPTDRAGSGRGRAVITAEPPSVPVHRGADRGPDHRGRGSRRGRLGVAERALRVRLRRGP
jgi:hypothetical protein